MINALIKIFLTFFQYFIQDKSLVDFFHYYLQLNAKFENFIHLFCQNTQKSQQHCFGQFPSMGSDDPSPLPLGVKNVKILKKSGEPLGTLREPPQPF